MLHGRTIVLACGVSWRKLDIPGFDELNGRGVFYGASPSDAAATHGHDVHVIGAGNSGGQAAMFFSNHARSVTIVCRGDSLEKSMSSYLIRQLATRSNITARFRSQIVGAYGDGAIEEIDIEDQARGTVERVPSGGVYIFIGADAETGWLPPEIALDNRGFVLTGADVAGRRVDARPRPLPARDERARDLRVRRRPLRPRQARRCRRRRRQHGDRVHPPVPARRAARAAAPA